MNIIKKFFLFFFGKAKTTVFQDIFLCTVVALTASFLFYEGRSSNITKLIFSDIVITALVFIVWAYCGFVSGRRKSAGFPIFACLYWCVPYLYLIYYASRDNIHNYIKWLSFANRVSRFIYEKPFAAISHKLGVLPLIIVILLISLTVCCYFTGLVTTKNKAVRDENI